MTASAAAVDSGFSQDERDILQELMNIAFGQASADLAEVIDIYVVLSVPSIGILEASQLGGFLLAEVAGGGNISVVEQNFLGKFKGMALLIFPEGAEKELVRMIGEEDTAAGEMASMEQETLLEIGNILIGACIGKVAELLADVVSYDPPRVLLNREPTATLNSGIFPPDRVVITMKTVFSFEQKDLGGHLFLLCDSESLGWLRDALVRFMERYE